MKQGDRLAEMMNSTQEMRGLHIDVKFIGRLQMMWK